MLSLLIIPGIVSFAGAGTKLLPVLDKPIADLSSIPTQPVVLNLNNVLGMEAIDDQVVRFTSQFFSGGVPMVVDMAMFSNRTQVSLQASCIVYTPPAGFTGADTFSVTITNSHGLATIGTVTATVGLPATAGGQTGNPSILTVLGGGQMGLNHISMALRLVVCCVQSDDVRMGDCLICVDVFNHRLGGGNRNPQVPGTP